MTEEECAAIIILLASAVQVLIMVIDLFAGREVRETNCIQALDHLALHLGTRKKRVNNHSQFFLVVFGGGVGGR